MILASAVTLSPFSTNRTSPGTKTLLSIIISLPSLITLALGEDNFFKAAMALSALNSWVNPKIILRIIITAITIELVYSLRKKEMVMAAISIQTNGLTNCLSKTLNGWTSFFSISSLNPC